MFRGRKKAARRATARSIKTRRLRLNPRFAAYLAVYLITAGVLAYGAIRGYRALHTHPRFQLAQIRVEGGSHTIRQDLQAKLQPLLRTNLFRLDLDGVRHTVMAHPWVADARVYSKPPSGLVIEIHERVPAGLLRLNDNIVIVGEDGEVIGPVADYFRPLDLPVLTGLQPEEGSGTRIRKGLAALNQIKEVSLLFWENIETFDISDGDNMKAYLRDERAPVYLGSRVIGPNLKNYLVIARHIQENYPALDYIELGFPNQVAIMPKRAATDRNLHGQK